MRNHIPKLTLSLFVILLLAFSTQAQTPFRITNTTNYRFKSGDTISLNGFNIDTANTNYRLFLGSVPVPIIKISNKKVIAVCPEHFCTGFFSLIDSSTGQNCQSTHAVYPEYSDTAADFRDHPINMVDNRTYFNLFNNMEILEVADINGDGLVDLVLRHSSSGYIYLFINHTTADWNIDFDTIAFPNTDFYTLVELNGKPFPEVMLISGSGTNLISFEKPSGTLQIADSLYIPYQKEFRFADLNSDGKSDIYWPSSDSSGQKYGIQYFLNITQDSLQFDTLQFLEIDTLDRFDLVEYSKDGEAIFIGHKSNILEAFKISKDSSGLRSNLLASMNISGNGYFTTPTDFLFNGKKELVIFDTLVNTIYSYRDSLISSKGQFINDNMQFDPNQLMATDLDSAVFQIVTSRKKFPQTVTQKLMFSGDTLQWQITDTISSDFNFSEFCDFNGDGYADVINRKEFRIYPSMVKRLKFSDNLNTINFLYGYTGEEIIDQDHYVINSGKEVVQIDTIYTEDHIELVQLDSLPFTFPVIFKPGDTLDFLIKFTGPSIDSSLSQIIIRASDVNFKGPFIKTKKDDNPPFYIKSVNPSHFRTRDTVDIILTNFRGSADSTVVFFDHAIASIVSLKNDTLSIIAPEYFNDSKISVFDKKHGLTASTARSFYMSHPHNNAVKLSAEFFNDISTYHSNVDIDNLQVDYLINEICLRGTYKNNQRYYLKPAREGLFNKVGEDSYSNDLKLIHLTGDSLPDAIFSSNKYTFLENNSQFADSFPFEFDTLSNVQAYSKYYFVYIDLDKDGLNDIIDVDQSYGTSYVVIRSRQFDTSLYSFSTQFRLPGEIFKSMTIFDLDGDQKEDVIMFNDSTVIVYKNFSRKGNFKFKPIARIHRNPQNYSEHVDGVLGINDRKELLVADHYHSDTLLFHKLWIDMDTVKWDSLYSYNMSGGVIRASDFDGDGKPDFFMNGYIFMNTSDSSGLSFDKPFSIGASNLSLIMDVNGDYVPDVISNKTTYINQLKKTEVWSELEHDMNKALYPFQKESINEPVFLRSADTASFSSFEPIYAVNLGLVPVIFDSISFNPAFEIIDSTLTAELKFPIVLDTGGVLKFYIWNNNKIRTQSFEDTLWFSFERGAVRIPQIVIGKYTDPPKIDSLRPFTFVAGDTISIFGKHLLNRNGNPNVVNVSAQNLTPIFTSDTLYKFIIPSKIGITEVEVTDTINHIGAVSAMSIRPKRSGPGGILSLDYFHLDSLYKSPNVNSAQISKLPFYSVQLIDINHDGQLDLTGKTDYNSTTPGSSLFVVIPDADSNENQFSFNQAASVSIARKSSYPYSKSPDFYLQDLNRDGETDFLTIDYGAYCSGLSPICDGMFVITPHYDSGFKLTYPYSQMYQFAGLHDPRHGAKRIVHDFDQDGIPDIIWVLDSTYIISSISDQFNHSTIPMDKYSMVVKYISDTLNRFPDPPSGFTSADIDGDGRKDLVDGGKIYLNESTPGKFSFRLAYDILDTFKYCTAKNTDLSAYVVYLNSDEKPDLICYGQGMCGAASNKTVFLTNKSKPGKVEFTAELFYPKSIINSLGDLNGDGLLDVIAYTSDSIFMYTNVSDTSLKFIEKGHYMNSTKQIVISDYDGDGAEDLIVIYFPGSNYYYRFYSNHPYEFDATPGNISFELPQYGSDSSVVDLNNSGTLDITIDTILFTGHNPFLSIKTKKGFGKQLISSNANSSLIINYNGDSVSSYLDTITIKTTPLSEEKFIYVRAKTIPAARIKLANDTLNFGEIRVGDSSSIAFTIKNSGTDTLKLSGSLIQNSDFSVNQKIVGAIMPGDSVWIFVNAMPSDTGAIISELKILNNSANDTFNVALKCRGIAPEVVDTLYRNPGNIYASSNNLDTFYIQNTGTDTLHILKINSGKYCSPIYYQKYIPPHDSGIVVYRVKSGSIGSTKDSFVIHHDYFKDSTTHVLVSYFGYTGLLTGPRELMFDPEYIDSIQTQKIIYKNIGNYQLTIDSIRTGMPDWITLSTPYALPIQLNIGDSVEIKVDFKPLCDGAVISSLLIYNSTRDSVIQNIIHGASIVVFDSAKYGHPVYKDFIIYNTLGTGINISLTKANDATQFSITGLTRSISAFDTIHGLSGFQSSILGVRKTNGKIIWDSYTTNLRFEGFTVSPEVVSGKTYYLPPTTRNKKFRDTIYLTNTGTDTLFTSSITHSSQIDLIDTFAMILPGDSGRIIFNYWTNLQVYQYESIQINHNYFINPKTKITLIYREESPEVSLSDSTLDFGDKMVTGFYSDSFYITNNGNAVLEIQGFKMKGDTQFNIKNTFPIKINTGQTVHIVGSFAPDQRESFSADLWLFHNGTNDSSRMRIMGKGIYSFIEKTLYLDTLKSLVGIKSMCSYTLKNSGELTLHIDSIRSENNLVPIQIGAASILEKDSLKISSWFVPATTNIEFDTHVVYHDYFAYQLTKVIIPIKGTDGFGLLSNTSVDHGVVAINDSSLRTFVLQNIGDGELVLNNAFWGKGSDFKLSKSINGTHLQPGDSVTLTSVYKPSGQVQDLDTLFFTSNSVNWKSDTSITFIGNVKGGILKIDNNPLVLGKTKINAPVTGKIRVQNIGTDTLSLTNVKALNINNLHLTLPTDILLDSSENAEIDFEYNNQQMSDSTELKYVITHTGLNGDQDGIIALSTIWAKIQTTDSFVFNDTKIKTTNEDTFWVKNIGTDTLVINKLSWLNGDFFGKNTSIPIWVLPNDSVELILTFSPVTIGSHGDSLYINNNDPEMGRYGIKVSGLAIDDVGIPGTMSTNGIELFQNVPNPGNGEMYIDFNLNSSCRCKLLLYDNHGRLIQTLFEGQGQTGKNHIQFNVTNLASGIYHYRLETENVILEKSMIIENN
ncbi:MAG: choice-of-anchor D domain-containing protein [Bacteroidetes bacterium]|nr:choice-of-anchor D domain-containing protein [Bacteroidota bacterium]